MRRLPLLLSLFLLLPTVLAGCTSSTDPSQTQGGEAWWPEGALVYNVTGPLYIPGFWPHDDADFIDNETVAITISRATTVLDAARRPTLAVNLTYHTETDWVTHWVSPRTGRIVTVEAPADPAVYGHYWNWAAQGEPALLGYWNQPPPDRVTVPCCPSSDALWQRDNGTMVLERVQRGNLTVPRFNVSQDWHAPEPRVQNRSDWNQRWPPGVRYGLTTPLPRAIRAARDNSDEVRSYMDTHPAWQVQSGTYTENPTRVNYLDDDEDMGDWLLMLAAPGQDRSVSVEESNYAGVVRRYQVESRPFPADGNQIPVRDPIRLMHVTDAWNRTIETADPEKVYFKRFAQFDTTAGGYWTGGIWFDGVHEDGWIWLESVNLNLETGLLASLYSREDPSRVLDWNQGKEQTRR